LRFHITKTLDQQREKDEKARGSPSSNERLTNRTSRKMGTSKSNLSKYTDGGRKKMRSKAMLNKNKPN